MNQGAIFIPFLGVVVLTIVVWLYMYYLRLSYIISAQVDPQDLATNREAMDIIPAHLNTPSENLINLFELPVLFYVMCLFLFVTGQVDYLYLGLAYSFLAFRVIHSVIHCTWNRVMPRFYAYMLSSIVLWILVIRAAIEFVVGYHAL